MSLLDSINDNAWPLRISNSNFNFLFSLSNSAFALVKSDVLFPFKSLTLTECKEYGEKSGNPVTENFTLFGYFFVLHSIAFLMEIYLRQIVNYLAFLFRLV